MTRDKITGGVRLKTLLESGKVDRGGYYLDTYNQLAFYGYAGTIKARIDANCMYFVSVYDET